MTFLRTVVPLYLFDLSMIFSENRYPLFRIMLERPPRLAAMRHKKMRPRSDAATDGAAWGARDLRRGGLIRRRRNLSVLCYAAVTSGLIHRRRDGAAFTKACQNSLR